MMRGSSGRFSNSAFAVAVELQAVRDDVDLVAVDGEIVGHEVGVVAIDGDEGVDVGGALAEQRRGPARSRAAAAFRGTGLRPRVGR